MNVCFCRSSRGHEGACSFSAFRFKTRFQFSPNDKSSTFQLVGSLLVVQPLWYIRSLLLLVDSNKKSNVHHIVLFFWYYLASLLLGSVLQSSLASYSTRPTRLDLATRLVFQAIVAITDQTTSSNGVATGLLARLLVASQLLSRVQSTSYCSRLLQSRSLLDQLLDYSIVSSTRPVIALANFSFVWRHCALQK